MTTWQPWERNLAPGLLARYVQSGAVHAFLPQAPVRSAGQAPPALERLRLLYEQFRARGICYADEPYTGRAGGQYIRPPDQVLGLPRHGNCLDLSVTFAGACLDAGLHPLIVVLDSARPGGPSHAIVVVWLDGDWTGPRGRAAGARYPLRDAVLETQPLWRGLWTGADDSGAFVAVDIAGVATQWAPHVSVQHGTTFDAAITAGEAMLRPDSGWSWGVGIDAGLVHDPDAALKPRAVPATPPLTPPYHAEDQADGGPLAQVRARNAVVRFEQRDEWHVLRGWLDAADPPDGPAVRVAILHGAGGAGKTRLAAEFAHRLASAGWYTGFLPRTVTPGSYDWLAELPSPLFIVLDYVEGAGEENLVNLFTALRQRTAQTAVLCTARVAVTWWSKLKGRLAPDGRAPADPTRIALNHSHPQSTSIYRAAYRRFAADGRAQEAPDIGYVWPWTTTLDHVLLGWVNAQLARRTLRSRNELYGEVLDRELQHWHDTLLERAKTAPTMAALLKIAACVSLLAPRPERLIAAVKAAETADLTQLVPGQFDESLRMLLRERGDDPHEALAVRPDPIADYLITSVFGSDEEMLDRCIEQLTLPTAKDNADLIAAKIADANRFCENLTRAAAADPGIAARLADRALRVAPWLAIPAFEVALTHGGPFVAPLEQLAQQPDSALPLAEFEQRIPLGHSELRQLALIIAERIQTAAPASTDVTELARYAGQLQRLAARRGDSGLRSSALDAGLAASDIIRELARNNPNAFQRDLATSLNNLSSQQSNNGDRVGALASITEAANHFRELARANPTAFLPDLASSLNNLSLEQSGNGDRASALASINEAVTIRRELARTNPAAFLPDLASSLNNLSNRQSDNGNRTGALASITEAANHYRQLTRTNPTAFLPNLASSLNNLSNQQSDNGDRVGALASITEAVTIRRELARTNPTAFLPDLASSLNNLSNQQSDNGDRVGALASINEAVGHYRELARTNPTAFLPDLATSLNNLSNQQSNNGDRAGALASITEAVTIRRELARTNPAAFLPNLANSLNNLSNRQSNNGDRAGALASITEAVAIRRELARTNPTAFLPDLANSLNNLSNQQSNNGDRVGALASITEAVDHYRELARTTPTAFLPDLAMSLNNLSIQQSDNGDRVGALASITEAVTIRRDLARTNPTAFLPDLANSLNNISNHQSNNGDRVGALASITEAVTIRRDLARTNPTAFLPDLAMSLNNLSNHRSDNGDHTGALASITEAVNHYRELARTAPTAFLPNLAASLNNLSNQQSDNGDHTGALASITEAVNHYRELARTNPTAFQPDLATSLNNLSNRLSDNGDHTGALASITEAVNHYRELARTNPTAFQPNLATSLNNLSNHESNNGDHAGALASIAEAVTIRRELARTNPTAFLPDLAMSLNTLSFQQSNNGDRTGALASITEAVNEYRELAIVLPVHFTDRLVGSLQRLTALAGEPDMVVATYDQVGAALSSGATAQLMVSRAAWHELSGDVAAAAAALSTAVELATAERDPIVAAQARVAVRGALGELTEPLAETTLPMWSTAPVSDQLVQQIARWASAEDPDDKDQVLRSLHALREDPTVAAGLRAFADLRPDLAAVQTLDFLLTKAEMDGIDSVLDELRAGRARFSLIRQWLAAPDWAESYRFIRRHPELITDPEVVPLLDMLGQQGQTRRHAAIIRLAGSHTLNAVYDALLDPTDAADLLWKAIETGEIDAVAELWHLSEHISQDPRLSPLAVAVVACAENPDKGAQFAAVAGQAADPAFRQQVGHRLARLAVARPDLADSVRCLVKAVASPELDAS